MIVINKRTNSLGNKIKTKGTLENKYTHQVIAWSIRLGFVYSTFSLWMDNSKL